MKNYLIITILSFEVVLFQQLSEVIETFHNGNVKSIAYHQKTRNGIEKVKEERYYLNGQKKSEGLIINGDSTGMWISWYENGEKSQEGNFKDGKKDGNWLEWDGKGNKIAFIYENGNKRSKETYKNDKKDGLSISWYDNGQKDKDGSFRYGK